ncbi:MAG: transcriptional regulator with XRE-family HTH domain [Myxococcota bacterium]|jgi:transcriptional regulator with XRE-family HTH domain
MSQLDLATRSGVSARHISFLETGRASPSREIITYIAGALVLPAEEQGALMEAAGYVVAPLAIESLDTPEMAPVRAAVEMILRHAEPFPAFAHDRYGTLLAHNDALMAVLRFFLGGAALPTGEMSGHALVMGPRFLRPYLVNYDELAANFLRRAHDAMTRSPSDARLAALFSRLRDDAGLAPDWLGPSRDTLRPVLLPVHLRRDGVDLRLFTVVSTIGVPEDLRLRGLRIESFYPVDDDAAATLKQLCASVDER